MTTDIQGSEWHLKAGARIDPETGDVVVPIRGKQRDKLELQQHIRDCYKTLPPLRKGYKDGVTQEQVDENLKIRALYKSCCGTWYRIVYSRADYGSGYYWRKIGPWRLRRWRKKGWL